jgi:hypothetical protein
MDDWKGGSMQEQTNKEEYDTLDNYFFGFSDSLNNESKDVWESEHCRDSEPQFGPSNTFRTKASQEQKANHESDKKAKQSPTNSLESMDSFDSVKQVNRNQDQDELKEISAKLLEKINVIRSAKTKMKRQAHQLSNSNLKFSSPESTSFNPSPMATGAFSLHPVNEQDEINHQRMIKHKRAHSTSSNNVNRTDHQKAISELIQKQKIKELEVLNIFKVRQIFIILDSSIFTKRNAKERNCY